MSITLKRSNATDNYEILSSYGQSKDSEEVAIVDALVKGSLGPVSGSNFVSPSNQTNWDYAKLSNTYVDTSALSNYPNGTVTKNSVLAVEHINPSSVQSYSTNLGSSPYTFSMLNTSSSVYDSNIVATQSYLQNNYDNAVSNDGSVPAGAKFKVTFDNTNSNTSQHHAVNTRWNTVQGPYTDLNTVGPDPIAITEDVLFNTTKTFGKHGDTETGYVSRWAQSSQNDGSLTFNDISPSYQPNNNGILISENQIGPGLTADDVGIFMWHQKTGYVETNVILGNSNLQQSAVSYVDKIPFMDANANGGVITPTTSRTSLNVPGQLNVSQFNSLFNENVLNTIAQGYNFNVNVQSNEDSGYQILITDENVPNVTNLMVSQINNDNILDNPYYMANYINDDHSIVFEDGAITISPSTGGVLANVSEVSVDLTYGETLTSTYAGVNGQIKIQPNTLTTRTTEEIFNNMVGTTSSNIQVSYQGSNAISEEMMINPYLSVGYEKVALKSANEPVQNVYASSNGAFLSLYTNQLVNNLVDPPSQFYFNSIFNDDSIRIWRIGTQNVLVVEPESFYAGYDNTNNVGTNLINGISVQSYLQNLSSNLTDYESYRTQLTAKSINDIGLYDAVDSVPNWEINYSDIGDTFLTSSSSIAFNDTNSIVNYDNDLLSQINNGSSVYFTYQYLTQSSSTTYGGLIDSVQVSYSINQNMSNSTTFSIPQTELTRTYDSTPTTSTVPVLGYMYSLTGNLYTSENWQLVQVTQTSNFSVSFNPKYGPFTNITVTINDITQIDTYYALQNKISLQLAPRSALNYVVTSLLPNLMVVNESITPIAPGVSSISGVFTPNDLKAFYGVVQGKSVANGNWVAITNTIDFDVYYGLENIQSLTIEEQDPLFSGVEVSTICEYSPFNNVLNQTVDLNSLNYYIPFVYNTLDSTYTISSFVSSPDNLSQTTNLSYPNVNGYLTVTDNYASTNNSSWSNNQYKITVTENNNITQLIVNDFSNNFIFNINRPSNQIFLGQSIVTYIPNDIWRSSMNLGQSSLDNNYNEIFASTNYANNLIGFSNVPGIQVNVGSVNYPVGCSVNFRVLGDFVTINEVGNCSDPNNTNELGFSYNGGSLLFQFIDTNPDNFSATFTLGKYRGYQQNVVSGNLVNGIQTYTIVRENNSVSFNVGSELSQVLTTNMYYGQTLLVNNLENSQNQTCANLNISFSVLYSIPPDNVLLTYPVEVFADTVITTISNPNYVGGETNISVPAEATPVENPISYSNTSDLRTYDFSNIYTFSGLFNVTSQLVAFRPSRVKMYNTSFQYSKLTYSILFDTPKAKLYKAIGQSANSYEHLGNPELLDSNDANIDPNPTKWNLITTFNTYSEKCSGYPIGSKIIGQDPNSNIIGSKSYFVSLPPYHKYEQTSSQGVSTPYNWNTLSSSNKHTVFMPNKQENTYNPYKNNVTIEDINGNDCSITNDGTYLNDLTITHLQPKSMYQLVNSPDSTRYGIIVAGVKLNLMFYSGLYNSTINPHTIYNGPITSIPQTLNINTNTIVFRNRNNDGSINFSIAQYPNDIGYVNDLQGYVDLFRTNDQTYYYNLDLNIGNVAWFNNNSPITYFNSNANGIRPTLYTVVDVSDPQTKVNSRRIYKYESSGSIKVGSQPSYQNLSLTFTIGRKYYDVLVKQPQFTSNSTQIWDYNNLLLSTDLSANSIAWVNDTDFNDFVYVSWSFGNSITSNDMPINMFFVENEALKWTYIKLLPFQSFTNQYGLAVNEISWDGSVYAPLLVSRVLNIQPLIQNPILDNNNAEIEQYSISSLNIN